MIKLAVLNCAPHGWTTKLTEQEIKNLFSLDWYEDSVKQILVDWDKAMELEIEFLLFEDAKIYGPISRIDFALKRYNETDGIYHA